MHHDGILAGFRLSRERVEKLILDARVKAGWIEEAALEPAEETSPMRLPRMEGATRPISRRERRWRLMRRAGDISLAASGGGAGAR